MQREAGIYGSIRVALPDGESEPFAYDYDRSIILTDWYHKSTYEQATGLSSIPFQWVGEPQVLNYLTFPLFDIFNVLYCGSYQFQTTKLVPFNKNCSHF